MAYVQLFHLIGEFGVVYQGYVQVKGENVVVAIKTLKGMYTWTE